jgi:hypothetical protein
VEPVTVIPSVVGGQVQIDCGNGHTNRIAFAAVGRATLAAPFGSPFAVVSLTCPTCGESSSHPVTGGADQPAVQSLFLALVEAVGCPCGALTPGKPAALVRSHLRAHAQQLGAGFVA